MRILFFFLLVVILSPARAQKIELLTSGTSGSFRGLSVVDDNIVWVSGSNGTVGRSLNGGKTWQWIVVPGYEKRDFRDIEAFDENTAVIIAIAEPASILKTTDGGKTWKLVYNNDKKGMFLDAMSFLDDRIGMVIGDPVEGHLFFAVTPDKGDTWREMNTGVDAVPDSGEACFASSGTNIRLLPPHRVLFITGGKRSRISHLDELVDLPIIQGTGSTGANSFAVQDDNDLIVVGGDFARDTAREKNCVISHDQGRTWIAPATPPHGYRSCVEYIGRDKLITCGTSGVDISTDGGMNWQLIDPGSYHVCLKAKKGKAVFLAGGGGRVAKLSTF